MSREREDLEYPLRVTYCGNCTLPTEYCEYRQDRDLCRQWLLANLPDEFQRLHGSGPPSLGISANYSTPSGGDEEHRRQRRGGRGSGPRSRRKAEERLPVRIYRVARARKKSTTIVTGLGGFGVDLKAAAKLFGTRFACGSSVTAQDEIVLQGDVKDELFQLIPEKWPQIDETMLEDLGDFRR